LARWPDFGTTLTLAHWLPDVDSPDIFSCRLKAKAEDEEQDEDEDEDEDGDEVEDEGVERPRHSGSVI